MAVSLYVNRLFRGVNRLFLAYHQMAVRQGHEGREDEADEAGAKDVDREGEERRIQIDAAAEVKGRREEGRKKGHK